MNEINEQLKTALADLKEDTRKSITHEIQSAQTQFEKKITEATKEKASEEQFESLKKEYDSKLLMLGTEVEKFKNMSVETKKMSFEDQISKSLNDNLGLISKMNNKEVESIKFKAATTITTGNFGAGVLRGFRESEIGVINEAERFVFNLISVMNGGHGSNPLSWSNRVPKEGTPAFTAEGALKPIVDWTYTTGETTSQFIAAATIVTKQALSNMPMLKQEINDELLRKLYNKLDNTILKTGTGVAPSINSIWLLAKLFSAGGLALQIDNANVFDVLRVAVGQVLMGDVTDVTSGGYTPTAIVISHERATSMDLQKTSTSAYQFPTFATADGTVIKGIPVYSSKFLSFDEFLVGDMKRYLFNVVDGVNIEMAYINDQFLTNHVTIRAELNGCGRIKTHDTFAFVKGSFTTAQAALEKP